jgi:hypothetical protein
LQRGRFRPPTSVHSDIEKRAMERLAANPDVDADRIVSLLGISVSELRATVTDSGEDFLDRIEALTAGNHSVLVSNYTEYYLVAEYLARYSAAEIVLPVGIMNFVELFREERYSHLAGGLLEAMGRLMGQGVQIYVYPGLDPKTGERVELDGLELSAEVRTLFHYLLERGSVQGLEGLPDDMLSVGSDQVYAWIGEGDPRWEENVLPEVVRAIKAGNLFGYQG